jgi:hypothetical protein
MSPSSRHTNWRQISPKTLKSKAFQKTTVRKYKNYNFVPIKIAHSIHILNSIPPKTNKKFNKTHPNINKCSALGILAWR